MFDEIEFISTDFLVKLIQNLRYLCYVYRIKLRSEAFARNSSRAIRWLTSNINPHLLLSLRYTLAHTSIKQ